MKKLFIMFLYEVIIEPIIDFFLSETTKKVFLAVVSTVFYFGLVTAIFCAFYTKFAVFGFGQFLVILPQSISVSYVSLLIFCSVLAIFFFISYHLVVALSYLEESWEPFSFLNNFQSLGPAFSLWPNTLLGSLMFIVIAIIYLVVGSLIGVITLLRRCFKRSERQIVQPTA